MSQIDDTINSLLSVSCVHPEWQPIITRCLHEVDPFYLNQLNNDANWLPGREKLFSAFKRDLKHCQYILFGESPYPRPESANGIAFHDAAVNNLWSSTGLSRQVNRATSLRNIIKTALLAEGWLKPDKEGKITQQNIAHLDKSNLIQTIREFFDNLHRRGFLMFNVTPVLHHSRSPNTESRYWSSFIDCLLCEIKQVQPQLPTLVLWGKIARHINNLPAAEGFPSLVGEHPYNLSFINNPDMLNLFAQLRILQATSR